MSILRLERMLVARCGDTHFVILTLGRPKQEDHRFEVRLALVVGGMVDQCLFCPHEAGMKAYVHSSWRRVFTIRCCRRPSKSEPAFQPDSQGA